MRNLFIAAGVAALASGAYAQSYSSFSSASFFDVFVTEVSNTQYNIGFNSNATVTVGANTYDISEISGFFNVSPTETGLGNNTSVINSESTNLGTTWKGVIKNDTSGEIAGYEANANGDRLQAGQELDLTYATLETPSTPIFGFHIVTTTGLTFYALGTVPQLPPGFPNNTPAPAALAPFGLGLIGLLRRRVSKA